VRRYLATSAVPKLHIGAGKNLLSGWLNTNWYPNTNAAVFLDATKRFRLPSDSFDYAYSEHMIEHLTEPGGANMIREAFRVLKPGGKFRLSTPDINFLIRLMRSDLSDVEKQYIRWAGVPTQGDEGPTALSVVNNFVRAWGHTFIYDEPTLAASMRAAGFIDITPFKVLESDDPELAGLENVGRMGEGFLQLETMTLQGSKPR
jgi:predicted SAM-dependent methyltransferase